MIQITRFEKYLAADVKRGRVKNPTWFRQRCELSPEARVLVAGEDGPAIYGVWVLIQQWANQHPDCHGKFQMKNGQPMEISELATVIGIPGKEELVEATINRVSAIGWVEPWTSSTEAPTQVQTISTLEERRGEETTDNSSKTNTPTREFEIVPQASATSVENSDLVAKWKGSPSGLLESVFSGYVVKMTTESPIGENCPEKAAQALLTHAVESGEPFRNKEAAIRYLHGVWTEWKTDGKIPGMSKETPQEV